MSSSLMTFNNNKVFKNSLNFIQTFAKTDDGAHKYSQSRWTAGGLTGRVSLTETVHDSQLGSANALPQIPDISGYTFLGISTSLSLPPPPLLPSTLVQLCIELSVRPLIHPHIHSSIHLFIHSLTNTSSAHYKTTNKTINNKELPTNWAYGRLSHARGPLPHKIAYGSLSYEAPCQTKELTGV